MQCIIVSVSEINIYHVICSAELGQKQSDIAITDLKSQNGKNYAFNHLLKWYKEVPRAREGGETPDLFYFYQEQAALQSVVD